MSNAVQAPAGSEAPAAEVGWFNVTRGIDVTTRLVCRDEPAFYLGEFILPSKSGKSKSRFQLIRIVRDDRLVTAYIYLGPAAKFPADQFQMLGGWVNEDGRGQAVHTVAELQDGADELRGRAVRREMAPVPLQDLFIRRADQKKEVVNAIRKGSLTV